MVLGETNHSQIDAQILSLTVNHSDFTIQFELCYTFRPEPDLLLQSSITT